MPSENHARAARPGQQNKPASLPGLWQAATIAALSALIAGAWATRGAETPQAEPGATISRIAAVANDDLTGALETVSGTPEQLAKFREREACGRHLAWVTIMRAPGQAPGRIRLQSGRYISPAFDLLDTPVRVAIPYPAPYQAGRGTISVLGASTGAIVALTPPWSVPAQARVEAREVTWTPASDCPSASK